MQRLRLENAAFYAAFSAYNRRMVARYIHEKYGWPRFTYSKDLLWDPFSEVRNRQGFLLGRMEGLGFELRREATLNALVQEVRKSSEIEGENLDENQVRSSIARRLGMDAGGLPDVERRVEGVVAMVLDATQRYDRPLTEERVFGWHSALFPTGWSGLERIRVAAWRDDAQGPMQVVSGPVGRRTVHDEAPEANRLRREMKAFFAWFEKEDNVDPILRAAIAHLWFVTLHPLDDGNGRIGRAIMDMALARSDGTEWRCYSVSAQIRKERKEYYDVLERTQKGDLDITPYLQWFLACLDRAMRDAEGTLSASLSRARFWQAYRDASFNPRQKKAIAMLFDGLDTDLTNAKWAKITSATRDTALRDLNDLVAKGVLERVGTGRGAKYKLISTM